MLESFHRVRCSPVSIISKYPQQFTHRHSRSDMAALRITTPTASSPARLRATPLASSSPIRPKSCGGHAPRSPMSTATTTTCGIPSSLSATPLSARLADMADRCGELLDEYFLEERCQHAGDQRDTQEPRSSSPHTRVTPEVREVSTPRATTPSDGEGGSDGDDDDGSTLSGKAGSSPTPGAA